MGSLRLKLKPSLLLSVFVTVALFGATGSAQNAPQNPPAAAPEQTSMGTVTISETSAASQETGSMTLPKISTSMPTINTGMPTLSNTNAIPTYPAPSVPPTQNAPYMNQSSLPDGTVFIAVGAILGAFGAAILAWRAIVACLLHRSVERAALAQLQSTDKAATGFPPPSTPFYKFTDRDSTPSLPSGGGAASGGRGVRRTQRVPTPSTMPSQSNLFFSPTAPGGGASAAGYAHRESRYLPSGFYAASSASPLGHAHGTSISMSHLRPSSRGAPPLGPSPPESPSLSARATPLPRNFSSSSDNLNRPPGQRPPSAYLDDLLDDNPSLFPPSQPGQRPSHSRQGSRNRF